MTLTQIRDQAKQYIDQLSPESLGFVSEFLLYVLNKENTQVNNSTATNKQNLNALELAGDLVGCIEAPEDLSTNKDYFQDFGE